MRKAASIVIVWLLCLTFNTTQAAERPTLQHTRDPRPDILPHPFYLKHVEYRRAYNRPTYWGGWLASKIAPSSQEAMVWCENVLAGSYDKKHCPPRYKRYYAPKPWEVLATGPRPDFSKEQKAAMKQAAASPTPALGISRPVVDKPANLITTLER